MPWITVLDNWGGSSAAWVAVARGEIATGIGVALAAADNARRAGQFMFELLARYQVVQFGAPERVADRLVELGAQVDSLLAPLCAAHAVALARADGPGLDAVAQSFADLGYPLLAARSPRRWPSSRRRRDRWTGPEHHAPTTAASSSCTWCCSIRSGAAALSGASSRPDRTAVVISYRPLTRW